MSRGRLSYNNYPYSLNHHLDYLVVGLPHRGIHRRPVHVRGGGDVRVPHQVLLDAERRYAVVEPRAIRVAESVPAEAFQSSLLRSGNDVIVLHPVQIWRPVSGGRKAKPTPSRRPW